MEIQAAIVLVLVFFLMLAMSVPVSFSIISASLLTIIMFLTPGFGMFVSAQKIVSGIDSFTLLAVPFFVLAGLLMSSGGIAKRLINLAMLFLGRVPGSLAMTNIAGNAMFGSISGSGIAAATAIGGVMLPLEEEQGIRQGLFSSREYRHCACGPADSPTASFIVYSAASGGVSVAALLMAGWVPGLLWAALCMVVACVYGAKARICDETGQDDCGHHFKDHMGRLFPACSSLSSSLEASFPAISHPPRLQAWQWCTPSFCRYLFIRAFRLRTSPRYWWTRRL